MSVSTSSPAAKPIIRHATEEDVPTILHLIQALAIYENALSSVEATESSLLSTLSFPTPTSDPSNPTFTQGYARTILLSAPESPTKPIGMALYFLNYSTWTSAPGVYLEDLFVDPEYRGRGYGTALIAALAAETLRIGGRRLQWSVLDWNEPSIKFYESEGIGAVAQKEWIGMRVDGERLEKLAGRLKEFV